MPTVTRVVYNRYEGPATECGTWEATTLTDLDERLRRDAETAPRDSIDKCFVTVIFSNGDTYEHQFGLQRSHTTEQRILEQSITQMWRFFAGLLTHRELIEQGFDRNPEAYQRYLRLYRDNPAYHDEYTRLIRDYQLR